MRLGQPTASYAPGLIVLALVLAGCGATSDRSPAPTGAAVPPSPSVGTLLTDLSVIGCAGDNPDDEGELTGAWAGNDTGTYYIRQVGDCVWWFGTEVRDLQLGPVDQRGFANVASGRIVGARSTSNGLTSHWATPSTAGGSRSSTTRPAVR